ncbi:GerW family sporulation protein [Desulfitibacter alkalitolerans]|uniref:GerW family sporulation protein n=1 Tax=Desulfitibacter alkalitolerans TaxID=264641 RepID=UPI000483336C|nr:GerW family sporulation protein [Desulfitibacter alkalitolerans]
MSEHPIEALMKTAMESIKEMVDVNTVVGDPVETPDGTIIIPISKLTCGFAAGGGEYASGGDDEKKGSENVPFGGGSGGGISLAPMGFLVVGGGHVRLLPVDGNNAVIDRVIDMAPQIASQLQAFFKKSNKEEIKEETLYQGGV